MIMRGNARKNCIKMEIQMLLNWKAEELISHGFFGSTLE
jgi:hypothetical protein